MAKIIFTKGAVTFTFSCGRVYPIGDAGQVNVACDYSDGGELYAYDKGISEQFFDLVFDRCNATDYSNFDSFFKTTIKGPLNTFTYTDESGTTHTVRCLNTKNPLRETKYGVYAGTINLREEI
ncbi:MAG: hypothetical protein LLG40_11145 [Deltaproteobacteria bacterium]|nr:hypothetical protein [Deltaproteobacteria bacterium]